MYIQRNVPMLTPEQRALIGRQTGQSLPENLLDALGAPTQPGTTATLPEPGQLLQAMILSGTDTGDLTLLLPDGTPLQARQAQSTPAPTQNTQTPTQAQPQTPTQTLPRGEPLLFTVLSSEPGGQVVLELTDPSVVAHKGVNTSALLKAFDAPDTPQTQSVVSEMLKNDMPPSKPMFQAAMRLLTDHPTLTVKEAVFMLAAKIPPTPENVETMQKLLRQEAPVGKPLEQALQTLTQGKPAQTPVLPQDTFENPTPVTTPTKTVDAPAPQPSTPVIADTVVDMVADTVAPRTESAPPPTTESPSPPPPVQQPDTPIPAKQVSGPVENDVEVVRQKTEILAEKIETLFREVSQERLKPLPRELAGPRVTQELAQTVDTLQKEVANLPKEAQQPIREAIQEIRQNIIMLDRLNQYTAMVQIPLSINGEQTTAELYVLDDNKRHGKRIDPQNATLFLSLGTRDLGRVEVFTKVLGKNVECDFTLESDKAAKAFRAGTGDLARLLEAGGYRLQRVNAAQSREPSDFFDVRDRRDSRRQRYHFDAKG